MLDNKELILKHVKVVERHRQLVGRYFDYVIREFKRRDLNHDVSKFGTDEIAFALIAPKINKTKYGSKEYKDAIKELGPALEHHYETNRHHPEHFENGVNDMTLIDIMEMTLDWMSASKQYQDGDIEKSIDINKERFGLSDQLVKILKNTVREIIKEVDLEMLENDYSNCSDMDEEDYGWAEKERLIRKKLTNYSY